MKTPAGSPAPTFLARSAAWMLDLLYPRRCAGCREPLAAGDRATFCSACDVVLPWLDPPWCRRCGDPFDVAAPVDEQRFAARECAGCRAQAPSFDLARAVFGFEGPARKAVHALKFDGRRELAKPLAVLLHRRMAELDGVLDGIDAVLPLPLHARRLRERGYNQAEELAAPFAALAGLPCDRTLLARARDTAPQVGLDRAARRGNVEGAFLVSDPGRASGLTFVIVDDVMTTGATVSAAAAALRAAGAAAVRVCAVARG